MSLRVSGKANEWVLILNNGKMKQCGIGLTCFKGPFDQVARFPSRVNKVEFSTEQVTKEMQGVKVTGMLVWSINRSDDGPFNAYKNLGDDLCSENPRTANENLVSMASAIVRAAIANASISEMLKNREKLRENIRTDMTKVVKGWGVWLETVEITDVTIMSVSLFKDLQANFRESKKRDAEVYMMKIESELAVIKTQKDVEMKEIQDSYSEQLSVIKEKLRLEQVNQVAIDDDKINALEQKRLDMANQVAKQKKVIEAEAYDKYREFNKVKNLKSIEYQQKRIEWNAKYHKAELERIEVETT